MTKPANNHNHPEHHHYEWHYALDAQQQPTLVAKDDDLFLVTDQLGNTIHHSEYETPTVTGLFCRDTRFLSRSELQIEKSSPVLLNSYADTAHSLTVMCTNPHIGDRIKPDTVGIRRCLALRGALFEEITVTNYNIYAVDFQLSLSFNADFCDLFEVRHIGDRATRGKRLYVKTDRHEKIIFAYKGLDGQVMESHIEFSERPPDQVKRNTTVWKLHLDAQQTIKLGYRLLTLSDGKPNSEVTAPATIEQAYQITQQAQQEWYEQKTHIRTDSDALNTIIEQGKGDISALLQSFGSGRVLAAGIPWFSALFGRDSLIAANQTLILDSAIARDTLLTLAQYQGDTESDWRDLSPGKILHELRLGEMARCEEIPHIPYYGTVDATPLWLMLYADYYHWTGDKETLETLWDNALRAMNWIDTECKETGYLYYLCRSDSANCIENQGWKDSGDSIVNGKGQQIEGAIALCEVQGYVYAAKQKLSQIANHLGHPDLAQQWQTEAEALKKRFNRDFWLPEANYCGLALDAQGKVVDSITSNPGHCLDLGIFTPKHTQAVAQRLMQPDLFSGWGIRTLSSNSPAYNPIGYHLGTVWPHDNALIAVGLRSQGFPDSAFAVAKGLFDMTNHQPDKRPPELFCGFERKGETPPVKYPVACSPQAWATGSIFQLLGMMLSPQPDLANNRLILNPVLPSFLREVTISNLTFGTTTLDLVLQREGKNTTCKIQQQLGDLQIHIHAQR
jgi:glycogen debranching enzyme